MARLGDVCEKRVDTIKTTYEGDIDYIDISSIDNQRKEITQTQSMSIVDAPSRAKQLVFPGDILVSTVRPNLNAVALVTENSDNTLVASTGYCVLRCLPNVDNKYVFYFCQSPDFIEKMVAQATGASYPAVTSAIVKECTIPLPPLEEQRRIAALLDKVSDLIAKRRAQLDKLDLLVKTRFVEMFGDLADPECPHKKCKLVDACVNSDDIKCGPFGTQLSKEEYQDHGVTVWEIPQINSYFTTQPTHFLTNEKAEELKAYSIIPGDIAMSRKGNVGRCALFPDNFDSGIIHSDVLRIRVDKKRVNPCFMMYQLHFSGSVQRQIEVVSSGAIMAGVNVTKLKHIEIYLPDHSLQKAFADFVVKLDKMKSTINHSLEKLETMKKTLMQQYFG